MSNLGQGKSTEKFEAKVTRGSGLSESIRRPRGLWQATCRDKDGNIKWQEPFENIVVDQGLNYLLDVALSGGAQITSWFIGLKNTGVPDPTDVMGSHATWTENTTYSNGTRPAWTDAGVISESVTNSASPASFTINGTTTIFGAFLTSDSVKGGVGGTLYAAGNFATSKSVSSGDTLEVSATFTMADDAI